MYATLSRSIMLDFIEEEDKYCTLNAQPIKIVQKRSDDLKYCT